MAACLCLRQQLPTPTIWQSLTSRARHTSFTIMVLCPVEAGSGARRALRSFTLTRMGASGKSQRRQSASPGTAPISYIAMPDASSPMSISLTPARMGIILIRILQSVPTTSQRSWTPAGHSWTARQTRARLPMCPSSRRISQVYT